jgi:hypothetical protein
MRWPAHGDLWRRNRGRGGEAYRSGQMGGRGSDKMYGHPFYRRMTERGKKMVVRRAWCKGAVDTAAVATGACTRQSRRGMSGR